MPYRRYVQNHFLQFRRVTLHAKPYDNSKDNVIVAYRKIHYFHHISWPNLHKPSIVDNVNPPGYWGDMELYIFFLYHYPGISWRFDTDQCDDIDRVRVKLCVMGVLSRPQHSHKIERKHIRMRWSQGFLWVFEISISNFKDMQVY